MLNIDWTPLSADTSFATCLFPVATGTLFVQKKLGLRVSGYG